MDGRTDADADAGSGWMGGGKEGGGSRSGAKELLTTPSTRTASVLQSVDDVV